MNDLNKQSISVSYSRTNAVPLDGSTVFGSFAEAAEYVNKENTTAYEGQIITVDNGYSVDIYKVIKDNSFASGLDLEDIRYFTFKNLQNAGIEGLHVVDRDSSDTGHQTAVISICSCSNRDPIRSFSGNTNLKYVKLSSRLPSIVNYVFSDCYNLRDITIPNSVTSIGDSAFLSCYNLRSVTIPDSVTSIDEHAFEGCSGLTSITIPFVGGTTYDSVDTHFGYIFGALLSDYNNDYVPASLKTVVITGGTSIGSYAFLGCSGLTNIAIPNSVTIIGDYAFQECSRLTSITLGNGVKSIGEYAFEDCGSLTSINIPNSVTNIGYDAFAFCSSLTSVTIGNGVKSIGAYAFEDCGSLTSVYISDVAAWCNISFGNRFANPLYYAKNLYLNGELVTELVIPNGVTSIGDYAFYNCTSLTSIVIPDSIKYIGERAFYGVPSSAVIHYEGTREQWEAIDGSENVNINVVCSDD